MTSSPRSTPPRRCRPDEHGPRRLIAPGPGITNWGGLRHSQRVAVLLLLAVGAVYGWGNFTLHYFQAPGLVLLATLTAVVMYAPSLWVVHRLDQRDRPWRHTLFAFAFVAFFATISSRWTYDAIDAGIPYWQAVGPSEGFCKMSPLLMLLLFAPGAIRGMRDGVVLGAIAGLSFAANEFATGFAVGSFPEKGFAAVYTGIPARWAIGPPRTDLPVVVGFRIRPRTDIRICAPPERGMSQFLPGQIQVEGRNLR